MTTAKPITARTVTMTENELQDAIVTAARTMHFYVFHPTDSRLNEPGFPDLVIAGHGRCWFIELKTEKGELRKPSVTKKGRFLPGQQEWIDALTDARMDARIVRPSDLDDVLADLKWTFEKGSK